VKDQNDAASMDPRPILELATGYWDSRAFLVANQIGVFPALAEGPLSAAALAQALGLHERPLRLLLKACVGLELLREGPEGFSNTPRTQLFLVPGSPAYLGDAIRYGADMWEAWGDLEQALADGIPPVKTETYTGDDPEKTRHFVRGMHNRAQGIARVLVDLVDLTGRKRLLDIGGGPGSYAAMLAARNPDLRATVLDLPGVVAIAREILDEIDGGDRVDTLAGDYKTTAFPSGCDCVLISGVFHRESESMCRQLIARAKDALDPGGMLIVSDVFADEGGATPVFAALFGLNMMLSAPDGGIHADADVCRWMEAAGFRDVSAQPFPPPLPHRLVVGTI
jgi:SAM-dependent methyltransferase